MLSPKMGLTNGKGALSTAEKAVNEMKTLVAAVNTNELNKLASLLAFMCGDAFGSSKSGDYCPFQRYVSPFRSFTSRVTEP